MKKFSVLPSEWHEPKDDKVLRDDGSFMRQPCHFTRAIFSKSEYLGQMAPPLVSTSPIYQELAAALRARLTVIADRAGYQRDPQEHLSRLQAASEKIAGLQIQLPGPVDPRLAHYLERCSYDKALAFLEG